MLNGSGVAAAMVGFGVGVLAASAVSYALIRRHLRRARAAERRLRASERLAELGGLTSGLAHEIKNPLSTIGLNAQLLAEGLADLPAPEEDRARLRRRVETLGREADRLRGILTDFLEYAGELRVEPRPTNLGDLVGELADFFLPQAEQQGVRLRVDPPPDPVVASVDPAHLKQALLNLMLNGVQAMAGAAGSGLGDHAPRELILRTRAGRDQDGRAVAEIHVIDTGPGIAPEVMDRIFKPYFTTKAGGTGLGLSTSRRIVDSHHGRIEVHSDPGRGTDFAVIIPVGGDPPGR